MKWSRTLGIPFLAGALGLGALASAAPSPNPTKAAAPDFARDVQPLLSQYCYGCHGEKKKGDIDLRLYTTDKLSPTNRPLFEKLATKLEAHEMPPENKPQPSADERQVILRWIDVYFDRCDPRHPDPGRVTLRRLNRAEYNNTIHDLLGVHFQPAKDFPADDSGYGFDNIGDVLSLSTVLVEQYLAAAEKILDTAIPTGSFTNGFWARPDAGPPEPLRKVLNCNPTSATQRACAGRILATFTRHAFRRQVSNQEIDHFMTLFDAALSRGEGFESGVKVAMEGVLVSPEFLFRGQLVAQPANGSEIRPIDDFALASRLSYFLWSSMPDEELLGLAEKKALRRNLEPQVRRMLRDPKAHALVDNFAGQWLQLRNLALVTPDAKLFPEFNEQLRSDMLRESELFFESVLRDNRSILDFLGADYTFLNERLARLYGIPNIEGDQFRRVSLKGSRRGGLLTQASILTITSNPTRTSPVKRGKWVLENILDDPPPPPPPGVPELKEGKAALTGTLRQRMEQHRSDPNCASCHARMDPIGFGFENYDAIGAWREKDGEFPIDAAGQLVSGDKFDGPDQLKTILLTKKADRFVRCLAQKMLTYALGRGLEYYDRCAVDQITAELAKEHYHVDALVLGITRSTPFQMMRTEKPAQTVAVSTGTKTSH